MFLKKEKKPNKECHAIIEAVRHAVETVFTCCAKQASNVL